MNMLSNGFDPHAAPSSGKGESNAFRTVGRHFAALALSAAVAAVSSAAMAVTVDSSYVIVRPDAESSGISAEISQAAIKLQQAFEEGAGLKLKIVPLGEFSKGNAIYLGAAAARRAGLMPSGEMRDYSNIMAEKNGSIYLFGLDRTIVRKEGANNFRLAPISTLKAIARFMEDFMNVRFLAPGDVGTDIPKIDKVVVPDGLFSRQDPTLDYSCAQKGTPLFDYSAGIFGRGRHFTYGGHTYPLACPPSKYFKTHPEYFGMIGGQRVGSNEKNPTLCISNPAVRDLIVAELKRRFSDGVEVVELGQQDGSQFCECEGCRRYGGPEADSVGEKIWIFHRDIAERILKECPGKTVQIICYSVTLKPPKTFRKFPPNVMVEVCHVSPQLVEEWKGYDVPKGFTAYIYLWCCSQPLGYTAKRSWVHCHDFAKMLLSSGFHGVFRCGYGEMYGLEGPSYWIFNRTIQDPSLDVGKAIDEYCVRAYGPACADVMRKFHESYDRRLRGINLLDGGMDAGALPPTEGWRSAQISSQLDMIAYAYPPEVIRTMEWTLSNAERHANTPKRKKRLELVRVEFEYVKNLAKIASTYSAYRMMPSRATLNPVLDLIDEREKLLDSICTGKDGAARHLEGWPEIQIFNGVRRDALLTNGRLRALLGAPLTWDTKVLRETDVLPGVGSYIKKYNVARTKADPSASNPEDASWSAAGWASLAGMQMERIDAKARFKMLAGPAALHVVVESQIPRKARLERFVRDGSVARNENVEIMIAPGERTDRRYRFVIGPLDGSLYDSRLGFVNDPRDPYYRKNDPRWNGDISITNTRDGDRWIMYARIPYATLAAAAPKPGSVWRVNVGRDTNKNIVPAKPGQMLWNPNLKSRWFSDPDAMGRLVFR